MDQPMTTSPSDVLRSEHQIILRVIEVLRGLVERSRQGGPFEREPLGRCVEFFRLFADACHHAKEEDLLFPMLEARGIPRENGPIGMMLYEHQIARARTKEMGEALDALDTAGESAKQRFQVAAVQYIELLTNHIFKEDNVLFRMGDQVMNPDDRTTLCARFCEVGCRSFGGKKLKTLQRMADELEATWGRG